MSAVVCYHCGATVPTLDIGLGVCSGCVSSLRVTWRRMDEYLNTVGD